MTLSTASASRPPRACRLCEATALEIVHHFGDQPVAGYLEASADAARQAARFPNAIAVCGRCGLVQQAYDDAIPQLVERVYAHYQPTYSMSPTVREYMRSFLDLAESRNGVPSEGYVLEIGSNDGAVLAELKRRGRRPIGLDPSADPEAAAEHGYEVVRDYFDERSAQRLRDRFGGADLVISRHTLEHVFEPRSFMRGLATLLAAGGTAVIEVPYLRLQLMNNQYQSMTFQHVCFFTVSTMRALAESEGLTVVDVTFSSMDGGSIVAFIGRERAARGSAASDEVIRFERACSLDSPATLRTFFDEWETQRATVARYLSGHHGRVVAYGAGSKGQALLNMLDVRRDDVPFVIDDTPGTAGQFIPGMSAEVVALQDERLSDVALLFITAPTHIPEVVRRAHTRFDRALPILATAPAVHLVAPEVA
ncbi:MAG: methyltransferase domain-containing protein [Acidobacteriota bacterium]